MNLVGLVKPRDEEIERLALREASPEHWRGFEPIARGPVFAIVGLIAVGLCAIPSLLFRFFSGLVRRD